MTDVKICADCQFCIPQKFYASLYNCGKTESIHINHITGERNIVYSSCQTERYSGSCGPHGNNFIQKTKKDSFLPYIIDLVYGTPKYLFVFYFAIGWLLAELIRGFIS